MKIDIVDCDTWQGLYLDDKLVWQDHAIKLSDAFELLEDEVIEFHGKWEASLDWFDKVRHFPEHLQDVMMSYDGEDMPFYDYIDRKEYENSLV